YRWAGGTPTWPWKVVWAASAERASGTLESLQRQLRHGWQRVVSCHGRVLEVTPQGAQVVSRRHLALRGLTQGSRHIGGEPHPAQAGSGTRRGWCLTVAEPPLQMSEVGARAT